VDSRHCHANWAADIGGVSFPLLADFNPKGEVAQKFGLYLEKNGTSDRATVIIDRGGIVRYAHSVTPSGRRNIDELLEEARKVDSAQGERPEVPAPERAKLAPDATLFVRDGCVFCRAVLRAVANLRCDKHVRVRNVTQEPDARAELDRIAGQEGTKVPALVQGGKVQFESADIIKTLASCFARV
jgi:hypothetical protein